MKREKYGFLTLISTVIGTVIGSGIFFKTEEILKITNGNHTTGLVALILGGTVMVVCAIAMASLARGSDGVGLVGYAEETCGEGYARAVALFSAVFYLPSMTAVLARVSGEYFCSVLEIGGSVWTQTVVSSAMLIIAFAVNIGTPRLASGFQIGTTAVKLIPLLVICFFGGVLVLTEGGAFITTMTAEGLFPAVLSASFAYEGWVSVTALGGDGFKGKNIGRALLVGTGLVFLIYVVYYIALIIISGGSSAGAFERVLGGGGGKIMLGFVTISCLGALNGLAMSTVHGWRILTGLMKRREVSDPSGIAGLFISGLWLILELCLSLFEPARAYFYLDPAQASISVMYALYIPMFASSAFVKRRPFSLRYCLLILAAIAAATLVFIAGPVSYGHLMTVYTFIVAALMMTASSR